MYHAKHRMQDVAMTRKITRRATITASLLGLTLAAPVTSAHAELIVPCTEPVTVLTSPVTDRVTTGEVLPDIGPERSSTEFGCGVDPDVVDETLDELLGTECELSECVGPVDSIAEALPPCLTPAEEHQPDQVGAPDYLVDEIERSLGAAGDVNDPGYVVAFVGQQITIGDCVPATVVAGPGSTPDVTIGSEDNTSGLIELTRFADDNGIELDDAPGEHDTTSPTTSNLDTRPLAQNDYGKAIPDYDGESGFGAAWKVYRSKEVDVRGWPIVMWQNADVTAGPRTKYYSAISGVHQEGGPDTPYAAASPLGEKRIESSEGVKIAANFTVTKKDQASANVVAERSFNVNNTLFGGGKYYSSDTGRAYAAYGGHREIADGYRRQNRAWGQTGAWIFPPNGSWGYSIWTAVTYKKCC